MTRLIFPGVVIVVAAFYICLGIKNYVEDPERLTEAEAQQVKYDSRDWKENAQGIEYFSSCFEGKQFIVAVKGPHGFALGGPYGDCKEQ